MDVFISYAREESAFAGLLAERLRSRGLNVWIDTAEIPPAVDFMREIFESIRSAAVFLVILSPRWLGSTPCRLEFEHASEHGKRIIPILLQEIDGRAPPSGLSRLNWIRAEGLGDLGNLVTAIKTNESSARTHARVLRRAFLWEERRWDKSLLLRGRELREADRWLSSLGDGELPQPTPLQIRFLATSRRADRRRRIVGAAATAAIVLLGTLVALKQDDMRRGAESRRREQYERAMMEGYLSFSMGRYPKAIDAFGYAIDRIPEDLEARTAVALTYMHRGEPERVLELLPLSRGTHPLSGAVQRIRAEALTQLGKDAEARRLLDTAPPPTWLDYYVSGLHALQSGWLGEPGAFDTAYNTFHRAELMSEEAKPQVYFGMVLAISGMLPRLSQYLARSLADGISALWPDDEGARLFEGIALLHGRPEDVESSVAVFERVTGEWRPVANANQGIALARLGRFEQALEELRRSVRADDTYPEALCLLGELVLRGDPTPEDLLEADSALRRAIELRPGWARPLLLLAQVGERTSATSPAAGGEQ